MLALRRVMLPTDEFMTVLKYVMTAMHEFMTVLRNSVLFKEH